MIKIDVTTKMVEIEGSKNELMQEVWLILKRLYEKKVFSEDDILFCATMSTMSTKELVDLLIKEMLPEQMVNAAMGDKESQKWMDMFMSATSDFINKYKKEHEN